MYGKSYVSGEAERCMERVTLAGKQKDVWKELR